MKKLMKMLPAILMICLVTSVFAGPSDPGTGTVASGISTIVPNMWSTVVLIVQMISVGCIVFAGLRYMFAGSEKKADIKKSMIYLAIGSILVFATSTVLNTVKSLIN